MQGLNQDFPKGGGKREGVGDRRVREGGGCRRGLVLPPAQS